MSAGTWTTIYNIAGRRHETKQGCDHMSDHGHEVLQAMCMAEAAEAVAMATGNSAWFIITKV